MWRRPCESGLCIVINKGNFTTGVVTVRSMYRCTHGQLYGGGRASRPAVPLQTRVTLWRGPWVSGLRIAVNKSNSMAGAVRVGPMYRCKQEQLLGGSRASPGLCIVVNKGNSLAGPCESGLCIVVNKSNSMVCAVRVGPVYRFKQGQLHGGCLASRAYVSL